MPGTRTTYRKDEARVTIACDPSLPLEDRMCVLAAAFTKQVRDGSLLAVEKWDLTNGCIVFIVREKIDFNRRRATGTPATA